MGSASGQYFNQNPEVRSRQRTIDMVLPDLTATLATDNGVFSADHLDGGTRYLLTNAPTPRDGLENVLDLGCGYGAIARTLAQRCPEAHVWAVDVNERALKLATQNLSGLSASVMSPDDVPDDVLFDLIWSNPPIRVGKPALHKLLTTWLDRLAPDGTAVLVVQKHLGADSLTKWLNGQGWATERLSSQRGFRLLEVQSR